MNRRPGDLSTRRPVDLSTHPYPVNRLPADLSTNPHIQTTQLHTDKQKNDYR